MLQKACFQVREFGKPHVSPLLLYRLLDVSRQFLLMHQNLWVALSTWDLGSNAWRNSTGSCGPPMLRFIKTFLVKKSLLYAYACSQTWPHLKAALFMRKGLTRPQWGTSGAWSSNYIWFRTGFCCLKISWGFNLNSVGLCSTFFQICNLSNKLENDAERGGVKDWKTGEIISFFSTLFR